MVWLLLLQWFPVESQAKNIRFYPYQRTLEHIILYQNYIDRYLYCYEYLKSIIFETTYFLKHVNLTVLSSIGPTNSWRCVRSCTSAVDGKCISTKDRTIVLSLLPKYKLYYFIHQYLLIFGSLTYLQALGLKCIFFSRIIIYVSSQCLSNRCCCGRRSSNYETAEV